ncbi:MAG TPA: hypothetical protein VIH27_01425 [Nitrososphaerales archaeon]
MNNNRETRENTEREIAEALLRADPIHQLRRIADALERQNLLIEEQYKLLDERNKAFVEQYPIPSLRGLKK